MSKVNMNLNQMKLVSLLSLFLLIAACSQQQQQPIAESQQISVTDYSGQKVTLSSPAKTVVALAPHIVENVFSVGAGDTLVGVFEYSNFPEAAKAIPRVGGYEKTNIEAIVDLNPQLILAWGSGNSHGAVNRLKELGFSVYVDEPESLKDIAKSITDIGKLTGHSAKATEIANTFLVELQTLRRKYAQTSKVSTLYQVWNRPLQTLSGDHIISSAIELCGGINVYSDEFAVAPVISIESVLQRNPKAIIAGGAGDTRPEWLDEWKQWPTLQAVQADNLFFVNPDHIQRHTLRMLLGVAAICEQLDIARGDNAAP